ncbi:Hypothetical protein POVN_LOCUS19 [uncultured virus]|nr:Hypothetical protein POVN_LOCUS19 [uncultured virus]
MDYTVLALIVAFAVIVLVLIFVYVLTYQPKPRLGDVSPQEAISVFIRDQLNALLAGPIQGFQFRVSQDAPSSTLNNIDLGNIASGSKDGCIGQIVPGIGCVGPCSWDVQYGLNRITGLGSMRVTNVTQKPIVWSKERDYDVGRARVTLDITAPNNAVDVYATASLQPCTPALPRIGVSNQKVKVIGSPKLKLTMDLVGFYDPSTGLTTFYLGNSETVFPESEFQIGIDADSILDLIGGSDRIPPILLPIIKGILTPVSAALSSLMYYAARAVNGGILSAIGNVINHQSTQLVVPGLHP